MLGDLRADEALAGKDLADRLDHFLQAGTLGQVARRASLQQPGRERIFLAGGHGHHLEIGIAAQKLAGRLQAADAGHLDVHQDHVRLEFPGFLERLFAAVGLPHHLQAIDIGQHAGNPRSYQIVVVDHQHPNQATPLSASRAAAAASLFE
ncbi:hypothetical protein D3C80_650540 [compost metagenome]